MMEVLVRVSTSLGDDVLADIHSEPHGTRYLLLSGA